MEEEICVFYNIKTTKMCKCLAGGDNYDMMKKEKEQHIAIIGIVWRIVSIDVHKYRLGGVLMLCKTCGCEIPDGSKVCSYCGKETPILKEEKKRKARKQGKWGCLLIFLLCAFIIGSCMSMGDKSKERYKPVENVAVMLACDDFSLLTSQELKTKIGKPGHVVKWNQQTKKGNIPLTSYTYYWDGFYGEFDIYDNQVVRLRLAPSDDKWKLGDIDSYKGLAMFGIEPNKDKIRTSVVAPARRKLIDVSEEVPIVDIYADKNQTVTMINFIYNENFDNDRLN